MLRATATAEVDSSRRRFPPHFRSDTIPHFGLVVRPLQLGFSDNTCRYDGERLWLSASLTYIRLSQVLPRFLSRAVSPVAHPLLIGLLSVAFDSFATATYRTSHRIGREVGAFLVSRSCRRRRQVRDRGIANSRRIRPACENNVDEFQGSSCGPTRGTVSRRVRARLSTDSPIRRSRSDRFPRQIPPDSRANARGFDCHVW